MPAIRGLIFDKDGTLFDFRSTWGAWSRQLLLDTAQGDLTLAALLGRAIGYDLDSGDFAPHSPVIAETPAQIAKALLPHLPGADPGLLVARMNDLAARVRMQPAVPLRPLFAGLKARGLHIGLATNDAEAPARAHLQDAGIAEQFDFVAGYDSGHGFKPLPGQLLAFAQAVGLAPAAIVMIGDSAHDLAAGRAAGMGAIAVLTGIAPREELAPLADAVLPDIGHLPGWLDRL